MTPKKFKSILKDIKEDQVVNNTFVLNCYLKISKKNNPIVIKHIENTYNLKLSNTQLKYLLQGKINYLICPYCKIKLVRTTNYSKSNTCGSKQCVALHKNYNVFSAELEDISELSDKILENRLNYIYNAINPKHLKIYIPNIYSDNILGRGINIGLAKVIYIGDEKLSIKDLRALVTKTGVSLPIALVKRLLLYGYSSIMCPYCGKLVTKYNNICGSKDCIQKKKENTNLKRYGNKNYSNSEEGKLLNKLWWEEKREDPNFLKERANKSKKTCIKKYGVENYTQTEEYNKKVKETSQKNLGVNHHLSSLKIIDKRKQTLTEVYGVDNVSKIPEVNKKVKETWASRTPQQERKRILKAYQTRKENGTHSTSKPELQAIQLLLAFFPKTKHQYRSKQYPYPCDFYIPEIDTYVEYQGSWVHGKEPYNKNNKEHRRRLKRWKEKAKDNPRVKEGKKGNFYSSAITVWTISDPKKRRLAKKNNLNWFEFFDYTSLYKFILKIRNEYIISSIQKFLDKNAIEYNNPIKRIFQLTEDIRLEYVSPEQTNTNYYNKRLKLEEQGKFSYLIRSYEWLDVRKRKIIKSNILHMLGKTKNKIFARKTQVVELTNKEVKQFQLENCFYGYRPATINLGLIYKNKLVMVTTFGSNFFGKKKDIEIYRVGTKQNHHVVGGMTKLIKHYQTYHNKENKRIKYYLDCCHHNGKSLIEDHGFSFITSNKGFHNYEITTGISSNRNPSKHKEIKELISIGIMKEVITSGTNSYWIT